MTPWQIMQIIPMRGNDPYASQVIAHFPFTETPGLTAFTDYGAYHLTYTQQAAALVTASAAVGTPFGAGNSAKLPADGSGNGAWIKSPGQAAWAIPGVGTPIVFEGWVYIVNSATVAYLAAVSFVQPGIPRTDGMGYASNSGASPAVQVSNTVHAWGFSTVMTTGAWHFLTLVSNGTNGKLFVDGALVQSGAFAFGNNAALTNYVSVGSTLAGAVGTDVYLSDIRVTLGTDRGLYALSSVPVPTGYFPLH